eukprot:s1285_g27.t1
MAALANGWRMLPGQKAFDLEEDQPKKKRRCRNVPVSPSLPSSALFEDANADFIQHLHVHGFAILTGVLGRAGADAYERGFWQAMTQVLPSTDPREPATWKFPRGMRGIVVTHGLPQADYAWQLWCSAKLHAAFASIYQTAELVVSLDAVIAQAHKYKSKLPSWITQGPKLRGYTALGSVRLQPLRSGRGQLRYLHRAGVSQGDLRLGTPSEQAP